MNINVSVELIVGIVTTIGFVTMALNKAGIITFGRVQERRECAKKCAEHDSFVIKLGMDLEHYKDATERIKRDISDIKADLKNLYNEVHAIQNINSNEIKKIREIIGSIKGYMSGIHGRFEGD